MLGPLEKEIMEYLWENDRGTVRDVFKYVNTKRTVAYTTIMTIMNRLINKGFRKKEKTGKAFIYTSKINKYQAVKNSIRSAIDSIVSQFGQEAVVAFISELDNLTDEEGKEFISTLKKQHPPCK